MIYEKRRDRAISIFLGKMPKSIKLDREKYTIEEIIAELRNYERLKNKYKKLTKQYDLMEAKYNLAICKENDIQKYKRLFVGHYEANYNELKRQCDMLQISNIHLNMLNESLKNKKD